MATRKFGASLTNYSHEFSKASHIFLKNGLWQISASLASPIKTACEFRQVWRVFAKRLSECCESGESRIFLKMAILASTCTRQKRQVFGGYLHSLNSRASSHCLIKTLIRVITSQGIFKKYVTLQGGGWLIRKMSLNDTKERRGGGGVANVSLSM